MHALRGILLLLCATTGCPSPSTGGAGGAGEPAPAQSGEETTQGDEAAAPASERRLEGTLEYRELPSARSVEAYLGIEFVLTDAEGTEHVLAESDAVPHAELVARDGQRVVVTGRWFEPEPPDPRSSYPTGPDGGPLERPGRYAVTSLAPAGP